MAKQLKKVSKKGPKGTKAFNAKLFKIRDQIDAVAKTVMAAKKAAGTRKKTPLR